MTEKIDTNRAIAFVNVAKDIPDWFSGVHFEKVLEVGRLRIKATMRDGKGLMGRFGGGWQWKLGIQVGSWRGFIISLFVMEIRVTFRRKDHDD